MKAQCLHFNTNSFKEWFKRHTILFGYPKIYDSAQEAARSWVLSLVVAHVTRRPLFCEKGLTATWRYAGLRETDYSTNITLCILYNQRDETYTMFFIIISAVHFSGGFSAHHQELIKLHVQPWVLSCFPAVYRCHAVYTSGRQHHNTQGYTYSFVSSLWWAEKPPDTCTVLIIIKNTV